MVELGKCHGRMGSKYRAPWDMGMRDSTTIIFFQVIGQTIRLIDCYEKQKEGLEHYIKVLESKPYSYGKHIAPHDIKVRELGTGITRWEKARQLELHLQYLMTCLLWMEFSQFVLLSARYGSTNLIAKICLTLENYRQEFDIKKKIYKSQPLHNWSSHFADSMRYLCVSLAKVKDGASPEDINKRYNEAMYGAGKIGGFFSDGPTNY